MFSGLWRFLTFFWLQSVNMLLPLLPILHSLLFFIWKIPTCPCSPSSNIAFLRNHSLTSFLTQAGLCSTSLNLHGTQDLLVNITVIVLCFNYLFTCIYQWIVGITKSKTMSILVLYHIPSTKSRARNIMRIYRYLLVNEWMHKQMEE